MEIIRKDYPTAACFHDHSGETTPTGIKLIRFAGQDIHGASIYVVKCPCCGKETTVSLSNLYSMEQKSCGCLAPAVSQKRYDPDNGRKYDRVFITYTVRGKPWTFSATVWAKILGVRSTLIRHRLAQGYGAKAALTVIDMRAQEWEYRKIRIPKKYKALARPDKLAVSYR